MPNDTDNEDVKHCEATTSDGEQCKNKAKYPEDNPKYCGVHYDKNNSDDSDDNSTRERRIIYN